MGLAYIRSMDPVGPLNLVEIIELGAASPPPRPQPEPPRPTHPIMLPGMPGWGEIPGFGGPGGGLPIGPGHPDYPTRPTPAPTPPPSPGPGVNAIVIPMPPPAEGQPAPVPPPGLPPESVQVMLWFGPGTLPAPVWVPPYASTGPVTPPPPAK